METLWSADALRQLDRRTIEEIGLPGAVLMHAAGPAAAQVLRERFPAARRVVAVCGPGNNGGDGAVVARVLRDEGVDAALLLAGRRDAYRGDADTMLSVAERLGVPTADLEDADVIVDALYG